MKNKLIVIIAILFIMPFILIAQSMAAETNCTQEQKAIQELIDAYYQRGIQAQYCNFRLGYDNSPEEATKQNKIVLIINILIIYHNHFTYHTFY